MKKLFEEEYWMKGNLHAHSTQSDGSKELEDVIGWYMENGYNFLAVTDHSIYTEERTYSDFVILSGIEFSHHTVGVGMKSWNVKEETDTQQGAIDEKGKYAWSNPIWL